MVRQATMALQRNRINRVLGFLGESVVAILYSRAYLGIDFSSTKMPACEVGYYSRVSFFTTA